MTTLYSNNPYSTLASAISSSSQTTVTVQTGHGDRFPVCNQGGTGVDNFIITVENSGGTREIINIVRRDSGSDVLTVGATGSAAASATGRGYEGTTATTWSIADTVEQRITAGELKNFGTANWQLTSVSGTNTITAAVSAAVTAYATNQIFRLIVANTNTAAVTLNLTPTGASALGAKNVYKGGTTALGAGDLPVGAAIAVMYDGTQFQLLGGSGSGQMFGTATAKAISWNSQTIAEDITVGATQNASSVGPVTISSGYAVTITSGGRWVVLP